MKIQSNEARCTSCHAGYGYQDETFDFEAERNVDCLVCHEQTGTYEKFPAGAGHPVEEEREFGGRTFHPPDFNKVAQSVSEPSRRNCGSCHFYGGGGDGVKQGDLDSSLLDPPRELDVHMTSQEDGPDFTCTRCHTTEEHHIAGRCYKIPALPERESPFLDPEEISRITCVSCHSSAPHPNGHKANDHTETVSCQSCHIPEFAREIPTKMSWDWSKAGRFAEDGSLLIKEDGDLNRPIYDTRKGSFQWGKNVVPDYHWYNGTMEYHLITEEFDPEKEPVKVNEPQGDPSDRSSLIYPFKVHSSLQPYDEANNRMLNVHLFGTEESGAYWETFDWQQAIDAGMEYMDLSWSGEMGFINTEFHYPITHMVAPKEEALECSSCHKEKGRLEEVEGVYIPGRDYSPVLNGIGWTLVLAALLGVTVHGAGRALSSRLRNSRAKSRIKR